MKVVAFNGSPRKEGNTYQAIQLVAQELVSQGIEVEIVQVGGKDIIGCRHCGGCVRNRNERCVIDDEVSEWIQKMKQADGVLLASPVHYADIGATMKSFLDRAFYVGANQALFRHKVGAAIVAVRRAGGVPAFDQLNHYLQYAEMLMPGSNYWNIIFGRLPGEAQQDEEGVQIMRVLGRNMAYLLRLVEHGQGHVDAPAHEPKTLMNFIR